MEVGWVGEVVLAEHNPLVDLICVNIQPKHPPGGLGAEIP